MQARVIAGWITEADLAKNREPPKTAEAFRKNEIRL